MSYNLEYFASIAKETNLYRLPARKTPRAFVIVNAENRVSVLSKMDANFRSNESARAGDEGFFCQILLL